MRVRMLSGKEQHAWYGGSSEGRCEERQGLPQRQHCYMRTQVLRHLEVCWSC